MRHAAGQGMRTEKWGTEGHGDDGSRGSRGMKSWRCVCPAFYVEVQAGLFGSTNSSPASLPFVRFAPIIVSRRWFCNDRRQPLLARPFPLPAESWYSPRIRYK